MSSYETSTQLKKKGERKERKNTSEDEKKNDKQSHTLIKKVHP